MPSILKTPLDTSAPFYGTHVLYLQPQDRFARTIAIADVTIALRNWAVEGCFPNVTPELLAAAKQAASSAVTAPASCPPDPVDAPSLDIPTDWVDSANLPHTVISAMLLKPTNPNTGTDTRLLDQSGAELAAIYAPVLSYGAAQVIFQAGSPYHSHDIALRPLTGFRRALGFVLDSAECAWEGIERFKAGRMRLVRASGGKKVEMARFESFNGSFRPEGVLLVNTGQRHAALDVGEMSVSTRENGLGGIKVSTVTAVATLAAVFKQRDGFYMPGLDLVRKKSGDRQRTKLVDDVK